MYTFRIYIVKGTDSSEMAVQNLRDSLDTVIEGEYSLEVLDVFENLIMADKDQVFATPTAVRVEPSPPCKIVGNMASVQQVRAKLLQDLEID